MTSFEWWVVTVHLQLNLPNFHMLFSVFTTCLSVYDKIMLWLYIYIDVGNDDVMWGNDTINCQAFMSNFEIYSLVIM